MTYSKINPARALAAGGCKNHYIIFVGAPQMRNRGNFGHKGQKEKELFGQTTKLPGVIGPVLPLWDGRNGEKAGGEAGAELPSVGSSPAPWRHASLPQRERGGNRPQVPDPKRARPILAGRALFSHFWGCAASGKAAGANGEIKQYQGTREGGVRRVRRRSFSWRETSGRQS